MALPTGCLLVPTTLLPPPPCQGLTPRCSWSQRVLRYLMICGFLKCETSRPVADHYEKESDRARGRHCQRSANAHRLI
jgi:hypothetical protein